MCAIETYRTSQLKWVSFFFAARPFERLLLSFVCTVVLAGQLGDNLQLVVCTFVPSSTTP